MSYYYWQKAIDPKVCENIIQEFNDESETKIYKKEQVSRFRHFKMGWNDCMYVHHDFSHGRYNEFVGQSYSMNLDLNK